MKACTYSDAHAEPSLRENRGQLIQRELIHSVTVCPLSKAGPHRPAQHLDVSRLLCLHAFHVALKGFRQCLGLPSPSCLFCIQNWHFTPLSCRIQLGSSNSILTSGHILFGSEEKINRNEEKHWKDPYEVVLNQFTTLKKRLHYSPVLCLIRGNKACFLCLDPLFRH